MNEKNIVKDCVVLYKWLQSKTYAPIFIWGHSIGSGIATITTAELKNEGIEPEGLILESSFTSSRDVIINSRIGKVKQ